MERITRKSQNNDNKNITIPCEKCDHGWGYMLPDECISCRDFCTKLQKYNEKRYGNKDF